MCETIVFSCSALAKNILHTFSISEISSAILLQSILRAPLNYIEVIRANPLRNAPNKSPTHTGQPRVREPL